MSAEYPFDQPVDPRLFCTECSTAIVATAVIYRKDHLRISGLNEYRWVHAASGEAECPPPEIKPVAVPYDAWEATRRVEAIRAARRIADDAYEAALEGQPWTAAPTGPEPHPDSTLAWLQVARGGTAFCFHCDQPMPCAAYLERHDEGDEHQEICAFAGCRYPRTDAAVGR